MLDQLFPSSPSRRAGVKELGPFPALNHPPLLLVVTASSEQAALAAPPPPQPPVAKQQERSSLHLSRMRLALQCFKMSLQYITYLLLLFLQVPKEIFNVFSKRINLQYIHLPQVGKEISA